MQSQDQSLIKLKREGTCSIIDSVNFNNKNLVINTMSCFSCHLCSCSISTETKTQLILYPSQNSLRNFAPLQEKTFKVKRNVKEASKQTNRSQNGKAIIKAHEEGPSETMDTISKMISTPSCQFLHQGKSSEIAVNQNNESLIKEADSKLINEIENKQNINENCCESILEVDRKLSHKNRKRSSDFKQFKLKIAQSEVAEVKSHIVESKSLQISHINLLSPHSSNVSNFTEKNLAAILLEKENDQLRDQLARLKQKQKELLAEQFKVKEKNNRELGHLKKRSQELQAKSNARKKELEELKSMLKVVQRRRESFGGFQSDTNRSSNVSMATSKLKNKSIKASK